MNIAKRCGKRAWVLAALLAGGAQGGEVITDHLKVMQDGTLYGRLVMEGDGVVGTDSARLYYSFASNETVVTDQSGNGNTGTVHGATWTNSGILGGCYDFVKAEGDYIDVGRPPSLTSEISNQFTLCAWINPVSNHLGYVAGRAKSSGNDMALYLADTAQYPYGMLYCLKAGGSEHFLFSSDGGWSDMPNGVWTFVAERYDGTQFCGYVNGTLVDSESVTGMVADSGINFHVGDRDYTGDRCYFSGRIDEVRVYARALTTNEIMGLYKQQVTNAALLEVHAPAVLHHVVKQGDIEMGNYTNGP
jgi:hypothetical protein